jgi:hypothetical protein
MRMLSSLLENFWGVDTGAKKQARPLFHTTWASSITTSDQHLASQLLKVKDEIIDGDCINTTSVVARMTVPYIILSPSSPAVVGAY